jgi:hypothetical protein
MDSTDAEAGRVEPTPRRSADDGPIKFTKNDVSPEPTSPEPTSPEPTSPEIEELDVTGGSGTVFMLPSEGDDDVSATVIFVDFDDVEGPL